jgi:uncharacterized protein YciI
MAGPFTDDSGGMAVIHAADERDAGDILARDPAIVNRVFVGQVRAWRLFSYNSTA